MKKKEEGKLNKKKKNIGLKGREREKKGETR